MASEWRPSDREVPWPREQFDASLFAKVAHLVQERVATLGEIPAMVRFFFDDDVVYDDAAFDKAIRNDPLAQTLLDAAIERFSTVTWTSDVLHEATLELGEPLGLALRKSQAPIRCAVTGTSVGPPLFESMELLGREKVARTSS